VTLSERARVLALLAEPYEGFASVSDTPAFCYAEELCGLFPQAVVVVTTRDLEAWWASKMEIDELMRDWQWRKEVVLWPVPRGIEYWPAFSRLLLGGAYGEHLGRPGRELYERHVEYLKSVVLAERLFFFDVKEGWAPLCRVLGKNIFDVSFPTLKEREAFQAHSVGENSARDVLLGYISRCWGDGVTDLGLLAGGRELSISGPN